MSAITCSLSGSPLTQGVISLKTGHVYEKSTILRHVQAFGTCPHTKQSLQKSELLPLAVNSKQTHITNAQYNDIDKIIPKIQTEYEALILQAHYLKNELKESRQQLAQSLYRQDAAIRVIARLQQEVGKNRTQIARLMEEKKIKGLQA